MELDQQIRKILVAVTEENVITSTTAIMDLGFPPRTAFALVAQIVEAKRKGQQYGKA